MSHDNLSIGIKIEYANFKLQVDTQIPLLGITAIFGHSGSGKSSLLRAIAGLEPAAQGRVRFKQQIWQDHAQKVATHLRPLGFVFQDSSLLSHLTVEQNLRYGWKREVNAVNESEFTEICELLGIEHLFTRQSDSLSGGERQRVAIAQALVLKPQVLLMDEPLASLDRKRKQEILCYLEKLPGKFKIPILYVSHSADEVTRLADQIIVMENGEIHSQGDIRSILSQGAIQDSMREDPFTLLFGEVHQASNQYGLTEVLVVGETIRMPRQDVHEGQKIRLHLNAKDISLSLVEPQQTSILNVLNAQVVQIDEVQNSGQALVRLKFKQNELIAKISQYSCQQLCLMPGKSVFAQIKAISVVQ